MTIYETPKYVIDGVNRLDELMSRHLYGITERQTKYGPSFDTQYLATSNTGHRHELPGAPFTMHAFQWADCKSAMEELEFDGLTFFGYCQNDSCWACKPNFSHPGSGLKLWWYKHAKRVPEANFEPSYGEWRTIERECEDWILAQPFGSFKE